MATVRRQNRARAGEDRCEDGESPGSDRSSTIREEHGRVSHPSPAPVRMEHPALTGSGHRGEEPPGPTSPRLLQEAYGNIASLRFHHHGRSLQPRIGAGGAPDPLEQEAHGGAGNAAARPQLSSVTPRVQRVPAKETPAPGGPGPELPGATAATPTGETTPAAPSPPGLIVEDSVPDLTPGQMRKGEFLGLLRAEVCRTAAEALAGTIWSAAGCPWIDHWFGYYGGRDSQSIERAIRSYAPESAGVATAREYVPVIAARVRRGIEAWATTGEVTGVPEGAPTAVPAPGAGGLLSGIVSAGSRIVGGLGEALSGMVGVLFKARGGRATAAPDPHTVQARLGPGRPLDSGVKSRMEPAFGQDFSQVRVHSDSRAGQLSHDLNARAFTVGRDVAFGPGEYQPGTMIGDALIAHELAHVVQQGGGATAAPMQKGEVESGALEEEADVSAVDAVASLWGQPEGMLARLRHTALPRLRSGLRLQRCRSERQREIESERQREIERLAQLQREFLEERARQREREERERARQQEIERLRNSGVANPENQVPEVRPEDVQVTPEDVRDELSRTVQATTPPHNPIQRWINITDKAAYLTEARSQLQRVNATASGDPQFADIARLLQRTPLEITEESAQTGLREGWYAWYTGLSVMVSMDFIDDVRRDPRNVFPVIAHEIGGHPAYTDYLGEISREMLSGLSGPLRTSLVGTEETRQNYFMAYEYQATEIYAALRQRRYEAGIAGFTPSHGAIQAEPNIQLRLTQLRENWQPEVARAVLVDLLRQARANPEIRREDVDYLRGQIRAIMGYELP